MSTINQPSMPGTNWYLAVPRVGFLLNQCYNSSISTYPVSEEQLKGFLENAQGDISLQEKLKAAADADAVAAIAKEAGFSISADDINKGQFEISDEELNVVNGGFGGTLKMAKNGPIDPNPSLQNLRGSTHFG